MKMQIHGRYDIVTPEECQEYADNIRRKGTEEQAINEFAIKVLQLCADSKVTRYVATEAFSKVNFAMNLP